VEKFLFGVVAAVAAMGALWLWRKRRPGRPAREALVFSSIERLRAIGRLSVYKVLTKEIVTETDHSWGEFGARYLGWVLSRKKMAMIFEFGIDFRYNLKSPAFEIRATGPSSYEVAMPPCDHEVHIRDIRFYDEQGAKLLPWLLPDLLNGFLGVGFSEEDKNRLVDAAKRHAEKQALGLIGNILPEVQKSATATLESISRAFGATQIEFLFSTAPATAVEVEVSGKMAS